MSFRGPRILKLNGGLGQTAPSDRNVAGLVIVKGYTTAQTSLEEPFELNSLDDLEALGYNKSTDANALATTTALVWYHVSEFFRLNPDGKLWVILTADALSGNAFDGDGAAVDVLMAAAENSIRYMGVVVGFEPGSTPATSNGFLTDVSGGLGKVQAWVEARAAANIYVDVVVVEGAYANTTLVDLTALDHPNVHITVASDHGFLEAYEEDDLLRTAAVGTVLGSIGVRMLSESIGSVVLEVYPREARGRANYSLVDTRRGRWLEPGLSTGELFTDQTQNYRDELTAKAYGYAGQYEGYPGVYLNADATCTTVTDDFNTIHTNRIWNECARMVRRALIPKMNSRVRIDPDNGQVAPATIADWDVAAKRELDTLLAQGEIASYTFLLDPQQDVIAQGKVITRLSVVPQGIAKEIEGEIGFVNPAQA